MNTNISFDNTEIAFAYKSDEDLKHSHRLFKLMAKPWLVSIGIKLTPWSIRAGFPVKGLIRKTISRQFIGGESLEQTIPIAKKLAAYNVEVILDYAVEGKQGEDNYEQACNEFIRVINFAATQPNIPFMSVKVTGMARFGLLERIHSLMNASNADSLVKRYSAALEQLSAEERSEWQRVVDRTVKICQAASKVNIGFLVDAEETWIQDPLDALAMLMMDEYNKTSLVVWNTLQMYRHDRLDFLYKSFTAAEERNFLLGIKLVRGAYMEKERERAQEKGYPSPIYANKEATDKGYNDAVRFCIDRLEQVGVMIATHNEYSNMLVVEMLQQKSLPLKHDHVHFSQLYGMSDNITFNLAKAGCHVSKYLPFGPIKDVVPYLMRRAQENTSVGGQTGRELSLVEKEMKRRGL
jgi:proline dehydrogenase